MPYGQSNGQPNGLPNGVQQGNGVAKGKAAKRELAEKLIAKPKSGNYRTSMATMGMGALTGGYGTFGGFTLWQVEQMREDAQVSIGLEYKTAPIYNAEFEISGHAEQAAYVGAMLKRFWQKSLNVALDADAYGYIGSEACYKREGGAIIFDRLKPLHPLDVQPWTKEGQLTQVQVCGYGNSGLWMAQTKEKEDDGSGIIFLPAAQNAYPGKGFWYAHDPKYHPWYGRSALRPVWFPWRLKTIPGHGGLESAFLWAYKHSISALEIHHPNETYCDANGVEVSAQDLARQMAEMLKTASSIAVPSGSYSSEAGGGPKWDIKYATIQPGGENLLKWLDQLDKYILRGLGIPDEILTHESSTGGYSRSQVALHAFFLAAERELNHLLETFDEQVLRPSVVMQWGRADYRIKPQPLIKEDQGQGGQSQGTQAGQPPQWQQPPGAGADQAAQPPPAQAPAQDPFAALMGGGGKQATKTTMSQFRGGRIAYKLQPHTGKVVLSQFVEAEHPRDEAGEFAATHGAKHKLTAHAQSAFETDVLDPIHEDEMVETLRSHYRKGHVHIPHDHAEREKLAESLTDLANRLDEVAEDKSVNEVERQHSRFARTAVTNLASKLYKMLAEKPKEPERGLGESISELKAKVDAILKVKQPDDGETPTWQGNLFTELKDDVTKQRSMFNDMDIPPDPDPQNRPDLPGQRTLFSKRKPAGPDATDVAAEFYTTMRDRLKKMRAA